MSKETASFACLRSPGRMDDRVPPNALDSWPTPSNTSDGSGFGPPSLRSFGVMSEDGGFPLVRPGAVFRPRVGDVPVGFNRPEDSTPEDGPSSGAVAALPWGSSR